MSPANAADDSPLRAFGCALAKEGQPIYYFREDGDLHLISNFRYVDGKHNVIHTEVNFHAGLYGSCNICVIWNQRSAAESGFWDI